MSLEHIDIEGKLLWVCRENIGRSQSGRWGVRENMPE